jgi:transposase
LSKTRYYFQKKDIHATEKDTERVQKRREEFKEEIKTIDPAKVIVIDEAGANQAMTKTHARAKRGKRVHASTPSTRGPNITMMAALKLTGISASMAIEGSMDGIVFQEFINKILLPTINPGDVIILDNLNVHKLDYIKEAIAKTGAKIIYLPPYSPDLSPIEKCWFVIKNYLRKMGARTTSGVIDAFGDALSLITPQKAVEFFSFCGFVPH